MTDKINLLVESLLTDLSRFQERLYKNEPLKFKSKRRYVCGLREVKKHLVLKHIKCVIVPPNMQRIQSPGINLQGEEGERDTASQSCTIHSTCKESLHFSRSTNVDAICRICMM